jgi:hypothetical protein
MPPAKFSRSEPLLSLWFIIAPQISAFFRSPLPGLRPTDDATRKKQTPFSHMIMSRFQIGLLLGGLAAWTGGTARAEWEVTGSPVTEEDSAAVYAKFAYDWPAAGQAGTVGWALLPHRLRAGIDFTPAGGLFGQLGAGEVPVAILPDVVAEESGSLRLVVRPLGVADWAAALSEPALVPEFSGDNGGAEVMYWRDGVVMARRTVGTSRFVDSYERAESGQLTLVATLTLPDPASTPFANETVAVSPQVIVMNQAGVLNTWYRDAAAVGGWRKMGTMAVLESGTPFLEGDRLLLPDAERGRVYRRDPAAASGWRLSGLVSSENPLATGEGAAVALAAGGLQVWERAAGTEDLWAPSYFIPAATLGTAPTVAVAEGLVAVQQPTGLEIHEKKATGSGWSKVGLLPVPAAEPGESLSVALAGDWVAVGRSAEPHRTDFKGSVRLFLRKPTQRSEWSDAGTRAGPVAGYGQKLLWDRGVLVSITKTFDSAAAVLTSAFPGGAVEVRDDDRFKLSIAATAQPEPDSGSGAGEFYVELPLPSLADTLFSYEVAAGSAAAGLDFVEASGTAAIPMGASRVRLGVTLLGDALVEGRETVRLRAVAPGQAAEAALVIRDSDAAPVATTSATPLLEGLGESVVTVQQHPVTGTVLGEAAVPLRLKVAGFDSMASSQPLAFQVQDMAAVSANLSLSGAAPAARLAVAAAQDDFPEYEEAVGATWSQAEALLRPGTMGLALDGRLGESLALPNEEKPVTHVAAGQGWLFVMRDADVNPDGVGLGSVECYRYDRESLAGINRAQRLLLGATSFNGNDVKSDGRTLAISCYRVEGGVYFNHLLIYRATGPAGEPWRLQWDWAVRGDFSAFPIHFADDDYVAWGPYLLERSTGLGPWRLVNDGLGSMNLLPGITEILATDGERFIVGTSGLTQVKTYRRRRGANPGWDAKTTLRNRVGGVDYPFQRAKLSGKSLYLTDHEPRIRIFQEDASGNWLAEQTVPPSGTALEVDFATDASLVAGGVIYSRIGPIAAPWVETGRVPASAQNYLAAGSSEALVYLTLASDRSPGVRLYEPGMTLAIVDDESIVYSLAATGTVPLAGEESYGGEAVVSLRLVANRASPVAGSVRVRSRDNGSAVAGVDYASVDRVFPIPAGEIPNFTFPIRLFSDRLLEGSETLEFVLDPPVFGDVAPPASFVIRDPGVTGYAVAAGTAVLQEPRSGSLVQGIEIKLQCAFDRDVSFVPQINGSLSTAVLGTDFTLPRNPVVLAAGENVLRFPIQVLSDGLDEVAETITFTLSSSPFVPGLRFSGSATIDDAAVPGLLGDIGYQVAQGESLLADGAGHPVGVQFNDQAPPIGDYRIPLQPGWGTVEMEARGNFRATPFPNVIGEVGFAYQVRPAPARSFLDAASPLKYLHPVTGIDPGVAQPLFQANWHQIGFDDSAWASGSGTLSYGGLSLPALPPLPAGVTLATPPSGKRYTSYFRAEFSSDQAMVLPLRLQLYCDDAAIIYINGLPCGRTSNSTAANFAGAPDTYLMLSGGGGMTDLTEGTLQTVELGNIPLNAGANLLAISLHNTSATSSDLGLRLVAFGTSPGSDPVPVSLTVADSHRPPAGAADHFVVPQDAAFLSSDNSGQGLFANDHLVAASGNFYDTLTDLVVSPVSAGQLELIGRSGHFRYSPPAEFAGEAVFSYQMRDKDGLSDPVLVTLEVQPSQPFDLWRQQALAGGGPSAAQGADPDGDGWSNFLEYALMAPPGSGSAPEGIGPSLRPGSGGAMAFSVRVRQAADLAFSVEAAEGLESATWKTVYEGRGLNYRYLSPGYVLQSGGVAADSFDLTLAPAGGTGVVPRLFYRFRTSRITPQ